MTEIDFKVGDVVVTSRGLYGTVVSIDESKDKSIIFIGNKNIQLVNSQVRKANDKTYVICYCTNGYDTFNRLITLPKHFILYDFAQPLENRLLDYCKSIISKTYKNVFTITHIKI